MNARKLEAQVDSFGEALEKGMLNWVKNDRSLNFLRATPARVVLNTLTIGILYGFGTYAFFTPNLNPWIFASLILVAVVLQKFSVRFVFDDDSIIDEYQLQRRNRAYRRAYKRVASILIGFGLVVTVLVWSFSTVGGTHWGGNIQHWPFPNADLSVSFSSNQVIAIWTFLLGLFPAQKYLSWGVKGEINE